MDCCTFIFNAIFMFEDLVPHCERLLFAGVGINREMFPVFWGLLLAAAVAWLFLSRRLYVTLKCNYPGVYNSLGSPRLIMRNSIATNHKIIMFILRRDYESTNNNEIIRLCRGLRYVLFIFAISLAGCLILLSDKLL